jgi:signal transduction histidine kinase
MELKNSENFRRKVLLAEHRDDSMRIFTELFGNAGLELVHVNSAREARQHSNADSFCACIVVDDLDDECGLELIRTLHSASHDIPLVLIADVQTRRIPLEEVSIGWNGCYIIKDRQGKYIESAFSWITSALNALQKNQASGQSNIEASDNRELLHSQRLESVGMLASGIAHDFNNILMAILGNASIAKDKIGRDHEAFRFVNIIEQCAERASALSNSLMRYARGEKSDWIPIFLPDHVDELLNIISTGLPGHVIIEKHFQTVAPVEGDATKLQQVIMNLCLNAGDAMNERKIHSGGQSYIGTLSISIQPASIEQQQILEHEISEEVLSRGFIRMTIGDNGTGMAESTVQNIFRPFFTTKKSGRGLGLSSVRGVIEEHGGFIEVSSEPGLGTVFSVYLPCCELQIEEDEDELMAVFSAATVLVIESDEEMRRLIGLNLQHMEYQVLLVENLDEALGVFFNHRNQIALILLNIANPEAGALQSLESLRRINESVPIVITTEAPRERVQAILDAGLATEYVQQPLKPDVLVRVIGEAIKKSNIG